MPKPVLASINGACAGLGFSLVLASDLAIAADNAFFTLSTKLGTSPDGGSTYFLAQGAWNEARHGVGAVKRPDRSE